MFNNLINTNDIAWLASKICRLDFRRARSLLRKRTNRVAEKWNYPPQQSSQWWQIPAIRKRWNRMVTGDGNTSHYEYIYKKYFANRSKLKSVSLGCGSGEKLLRWAQTGIFANIEGYDLSESLIEQATDQSKKSGYDDVVKYHLADVATLQMPKKSLDVVFTEDSLHHFSRLETVLPRINSWLKPDGYFLAREFVGPTRFQWTDRQLEIINSVLGILPPRYRVLPDGRSIKRKVTRPSRMRMILRDPSEAVESSRIMPLLHETFEVVEICEYGGTILHPLFANIAHNFTSNDQQTQILLSLCFAIEDYHLSTNQIESDFAIIICKKKW